MNARLALQLNLDEDNSIAGDDHMSSFIRCLQPRALAALHGLTEQSGQNWWKDLLTLWKPSGSAAGAWTSTSDQK
jgi:hypothetical protein